MSDVSRPAAAEDAAGSGPPAGPRVVRDLLTTGSIQAVLLLPSLVLSVIGLFVMGVNEYAVWAILFSLGSAAIVLDLGAFPLAQIFRAQGHVNGRELTRLLLQASTIPIALILVTTIGWSWFADVFLGGRAAGGPGIALLLGTGTLIRAWQNVANGFALATASERARLRAGIASGVVQLAAVLLVFVMAPLTALCVAYLLGSIVGLAMLAPIAFASLGAAPPRDHPVVAWRTAAAGLAVVLTQLDRLVVGALGASAATLAAYDLAARVVIMAKMGTVLLSTGLVAKSVRASRDHYPVEPAQLRHAAQRLIDRVAVVVFIPLPLVVLVVALAARPSLAGTACAICALLAVGQGFNATTAPTTAVLSGLGRLVPEVTYEAIAVLIMLSLSATIASASPGIGVAFSLSVGLLVGSVWIRRFGGRMLTAEGR